MGPLAHGQSLPSPRAQTLQADVRLAEQRARDARLAAREREASAQRAIELRRELIEEIGPADPRLPEWIATQAGELLSELARDASDTACLVGLATPAQRLAVGRAAGEADRLAERGLKLAEEQWQRLGGVGSDRPGAAELEQLVTVRFPFVRGRALALLASLAGGPELDRLARLGFDQVAKMELVLPGPESARRVTAAMCLLLRGEGDRGTDRTLARDEATRALATSEATPSTRVEAWLVLLAATGGDESETTRVVEGFEKAMRQPPLAVESGERVDAIVAVLSADAQTRVLWERGVAERSRGLLDRAVLAQERLLAREDLTVSGGREGVLGAVVYDKLARLELPGEGVEPPAMVRLARAVLSAREPGGRVLALASLTALAEAEDARWGDVGCEALWERAVLLLTPEDEGEVTGAERLEAASALVDLAERFPEHRRARAALEAGVMHARGLALGKGGGEGLYRRGLLLATERGDAAELKNIDLWRYERGRLAVAAAENAGDDARVTAELLAAAVHVRRIAAEPEEPIKAEDVQTLGERVQELALDRLWSQIRAARAAGRGDRVRQLAAERVAVEAKRAAEWARVYVVAGRGSALRDRFEADLADALVEAGDVGAAGWYEALLRPRESGDLARVRAVPGGAARLELGLGRARLIEGKEAEAFGLFKSAAERADSAIDGGGRSEIFWHAWALMLETLGRQNAGGDRSGTIRAQVRRLEAIDRQLGGEHWAGRIRAVEGKL